MNATVALTADQIEALVKKMGGEKAVKCFLRDKLVQVAELPQNVKIDGKLLCTVFQDRDGDRSVMFSSSKKELANHSVRFIVRDGQTGDQLLTDTVHLEINDDIVRGSSKLPFTVEPCTIECELV